MPGYGKLEPTPLNGGQETRGAGIRPGPDRPKKPRKSKEPVAPVLPPSPAGLKAWRTRQQIDKARAASRLGCSRNAYSRWEAGLSVIPNYIMLACAALERGLPPID